MLRQIVLLVAMPFATSSDALNSLVRGLFTDYIYIYSHFPIFLSLSIYIVISLSFSLSLYIYNYIYIYINVCFVCILYMYIYLYTLLFHTVDFIAVASATMGMMTMTTV